VNAISLEVVAIDRKHAAEGLQFGEANAAAAPLPITQP
jgi:hypothetical protein